MKWFIVATTYAFLALGFAVAWQWESAVLVGGVMLAALAAAIIFATPWKRLLLSGFGGRLEAATHDLEEEVKQADESLAQSGQAESERRVIIERLMSEAAEWGWAMSAILDSGPPQPYIEWTREGEPRILFGTVKYTGEGFGLKKTAKGTSP